MSEQNHDVWAALAYWLANKDDAMLAHSILLNLGQNPGISDGVIKRLKEIADAGPNESSKTLG